MAIEFESVVVDGCPQVGTGGSHSSGFYEGENCSQCGMVSPMNHKDRKITDVCPACGAEAGISCNDWIDAKSEQDPEILDAENNHGQGTHFTVMFVQPQADNRIHAIFSIDGKVKEDRAYEQGLEGEASMGMDVTNWINNHF